MIIGVDKGLVGNACCMCQVYVVVESGILMGG